MKIKKNIMSIIVLEKLIKTAYLMYKLIIKIKFLIIINNKKK